MKKPVPPKGGIAKNQVPTDIAFGDVLFEGPKSTQKVLANLNSLTICTIRKISMLRQQVRHLYFITCRCEKMFESWQHSFYSPLQTNL